LKNQNFLNNVCNNFDNKGNSSLAKFERFEKKHACLKETQHQNTSGFQMKVENTSYTMIPKILATADPSIFN